MRKSVSILFILLVVAGVSACAKPARHVNTPDEQRSHAGQAQDELSSEVRK